jgi:Family of unknown function (DUF6174)
MKFLITIFACIMLPFGTHCISPPADSEIDYDYYYADGPCDSNWNKTAQEYRQAVEKWGNPSCYTYTIKRICFCPETITARVNIKVVNGTIVEPKNKVVDELWLSTMAELFDQVNKLCVKNCPAKGAAHCEITYGGAGNLRFVYIDESERIADEEVMYTITKYRTCKN